MPTLMQLLGPQPLPPQPPPWLTQFGQFTSQRQLTPMDLQLRDLQHQAFTRMLMEQYGPVVGRLLALLAVPSWQGMKFTAQSGFPGMQRLSQQLPYGVQPHLGTPPTWGQLRTGLAPIFQPTPAFNPYRGPR